MPFKEASFGGWGLHWGNSGVHVTWFSFLSDGNRNKNTKGTAVPYSHLCVPSLPTPVSYRSKLGDFTQPILMEYLEAPMCRDYAFHILCCLHRKVINRTQEKAPHRVDLAYSSTGKQEQIHLGPASQEMWKMEIFLFCLVWRTNQNNTVFDLFLHLIMQGPVKSSLSLSPQPSVLHPNYREHRMLREGLIFPLNFWPSPKLWPWPVPWVIQLYAPVCCQNMSSAFPDSLYLRYPGVTSRMLPNFPPEPGTLFYIPVCPQSASSSHGHYSLLSIWVEKSLLGISGRAKMPTTQALCLLNIFSSWHTHMNKLNKCLLG